MFNSNILEVAIGMIFIYLLLSLMCSAASEMIELLLKKRAIDLERGVRELLAPGTKSGTSDIVQKLYDHALVNNLFGNTYAESRIGNPFRRIFRTKLPSYIPARNFALALMDLVALPERPASERPSTPPPASTQAPKEPTAPATKNDNPADVPLEEKPEAIPAGAQPQSPDIEPPSGAAGATVGPRAQTPAQLVLNVPLPAGGIQLQNVRDPVSPSVVSPGPESQAAKPGDKDNPLTPLRNAISVNPLLTEVTKRSLITLLDAAGNDVAKARENIENWYNSSMDRVSGWYKRRAQLTILVIGIFVAIAVNVDTITIAKRLSTDRALRDTLVNAADVYAKANASPSPSPTPTPTSEPEAKGQTPGTTAPANPSPNPEVKKSPEPTPSATPLPTPPPACVSDRNSENCLAAMKEVCEDEDSAACRIAKGCVEADSTECRRAKNLVRACDDPNSPKCKYLNNQYQLQSLGLPIGWDSPDDPKRKWPGTRLCGVGGWWDQLYSHGLGWILTALAISLGAPFWFDLLNKFIVIRSAVKPHEKSPEEESKD
jgi:hypothetical protein